MKITVYDLDVFSLLLLRFHIALVAFILLLMLTKRRVTADLREIGLGIVVFLGVEASGYSE